MIGVAVGTLSKKSGVDVAVGVGVSVAIVAVGVASLVRNGFKSEGLVRAASIDSPIRRNKKTLLCMQPWFLLTGTAIQ